MVINAKYHLIFRTRYWFVLTYQILNHLFIFSYTVLWDTFVIFIQLNNMYVMILMLFTFPSTSFCQSILLLCLLFCLLKCAPQHRRHCCSVQNGTSYLSITLQISGYAAQSAFECYSRFLSFVSLALSCIDLSSTFSTVQLQNGSTSSGLDPSQQPRL